MHHITSRASPAITTIEVDGDLDVVGAYDLQRSLDAAVLQGVHRVGLDLTRVTFMDDAGIHGLMRCCDTAVVAGMKLSLIGCSRPTLAALRRFHARPARR